MWSEAVAAGVDGCRAGWIAVSASVDRRRTAVELFSSVEELVAACERAPAGRRPVVAIDVPLGLPEPGARRAADAAARTALGPRRMSVFTPPDRELLGHDFHNARAIVHRRRLDDPAGDFPVPTHEAINIASRIAQADRVLRADPGRQEWLVEAHPEDRLAGAASRWRRAQVGFDDLLDAYAALWTALRVADGRATMLGDGAPDAFGLRQRIMA